MDKKVEMSFMFDFYGELLTKKQQEIVSMYCNQDLSLAEIAERLEITRQGVHDALKHSEKTLYEMEEKLKLVEKFLNQKNMITNALKNVNALESEINNNKADAVNNRIETIKSILESVISNS